MPCDPTDWGQDLMQLEGTEWTSNVTKVVCRDPTGLSRRIINGSFGLVLYKMLQFEQSKQIIVKLLWKSCFFCWKMKMKRIKRRKLYLKKATIWTLLTMYVQICNMSTHVKLGRRWFGIEKNSCCCFLTPEYNTVSCWPYLTLGIAGVTVNRFIFSLRYAAVRCAFKW